MLHFYMGVPLWWDYNDRNIEMKFNSPRSKFWELQPNLHLFWIAIVHISISVVFGDIHVVSVIMTVFYSR